MKEQRPDGAGSGRQQSIKRRVVRLVLVPGVVALLLWFVASGYLVIQGYYNRAVATSVRDVSIPAVSALSAIQQERRLSIAFLSRPQESLAGLLAQRRQTDQEVADLRKAADEALSSAPGRILGRWTTLSGLIDQMANTRSTVDARSARTADVYAFYNQVLDASAELFDTQAREVPDVDAAQDGLTGTFVFRASDLMSRAASTMDGAFASGTFSEASYLEFVRLVGGYHSLLDTAAPHLEPGVTEQWQAFSASSEWKQLLAMEDDIVASGPWRKPGVPAALAGAKARWTPLTDGVSGNLVAMTTGQADQVSAKALDTGDQQLLIALLGSLAALSIAGAAIVWAIRQSRVLVDRALSTRLAKLGAEADDMVDQRLPAVMNRLAQRESVDLATEFAGADYGDDEIGQVAAVINRSLRAAAGAAVNEARARAAGTAMLMGVARRPQRPLQRGLKVVEDLQDRIGDEKLLTELFDIHHQLNQTRRFLENLVILAGGQIGRRFTTPVPLRRVLLASFAEARNYQRITLRGATDVSLVGHAVAEVIHLLAELLDNALAFSPPSSTVWVNSSQVNHGVAIEIEDAGVGMSAEAVERANRLLATAPTPDVTELKDGAQVGLYVVAELAKREGVQVSLRRSAYGGLLAIVLVPDRLLVSGAASTPDDEVPAALRPVTVPAAAADAEPVRTPVMAGPATARREAEPAADAWAPEPNAEFDTVIFAAVTNRAPVGVIDAKPGDVQAAPVGSHRPAIAPPAPAPSPSAPAAPARHAPQQRSAAANGAASGGTSRPPLPHRRPQSHLVPELREEDAPTTVQASPTRSPEESRDRFARYQQGRTAGRTTSPRDDVPTNSDQGRNP